MIVAGEPRGKTPLQLKLPAYERYDVQVALPGGKPFRKAVYLKGQTTLVQAVLTRPAKR